MITRLTGLSAPRRRAALAGLERIFFDASVRKSFPDAAARAAFLETWTGWYLREAPDDVMLWLDDDGAVIGYLTGCRDSAGAAELFRIIPAYDRFADLFDAFPAHLHVNVDAAHRGRGVGAALVKAFREEVGTGVHIVTGVEARNIAFYSRLGFVTLTRRDPMLFMGSSGS